MPDGQDLINELEYDERIRNMTAKQRSLYTAQKVYEISCRCPVMEDRVAALERGNRKASGVTGGITGGIISACIVIVEYFRRGG